MTAEEEDFVASEPEKVDALTPPTSLSILASRDFEVNESISESDDKSLLKEDVDDAAGPEDESDDACIDPATDEKEYGRMFGDTGMSELELLDTDE